MKKLELRKSTITRLNQNSLTNMKGGQTGTTCFDTPPNSILPGCVPSNTITASNKDCYSLDPNCTDLPIQSLDLCTQGVCASQGCGSLTPILSALKLC